MTLREGYLYMPVFFMVSLLSFNLKPGDKTNLHPSIGFIEIVVVCQKPHLWIKLVFFIYIALYQACGMHIFNFPKRLSTTLFFYEQGSCRFFMEMRSGYP